ncbi:MAG: DUF4160 domain-containing protein [Burkholderiaceae bacterium]|jgi:hypothetical protein|nr:DUF4160 domain-containing protein [Burkholderiaceae bacterium]
MQDWMIKVLYDERPVHAHVIHPDGMAVVFLGDSVLSAHRKVPAAVIRTAAAWVAAHEAEVRAEWSRLDNPEDRGETP